MFVGKLHTHYDNLKVARNAPIEVIRAAYRSLAQKYHPDHNPNDREAARIMTLVNASYAVLSDSEQRRKHDDWIYEQELGGKAEFRQSTSPNAGGFSFSSGSVVWSALPEEARAAIADRVSSHNREQHAVDLSDVGLKKELVVLLPLWFVYLLYSSFGDKWTDDTTTWFVTISVIVAICIAYCSAAVLRWKKSPLKRWLLVTPIYLIETEYVNVSFWPITEITDIKATHNYRNGGYENTVVRLRVGDLTKQYTLHSEKAYEDLIQSIKKYDKNLRVAIAARDEAYLTIHDDFRAGTKRSSDDRAHVAVQTITYKAYAATSIACALALGIALAINSTREPQRISFPQLDSVVPPTPTYKRTLTAPNGENWPEVSGYVRGYPQLHTNGLSSITVDNTQSRADAFVKVVALSPKGGQPVRQFLVLAGDAFKATGLSAGAYDVRFKNLDNGQMAKSERFELEERHMIDTVRYSALTVTLYTVRGGNMRTSPIADAEFNF